MRSLTPLVIAALLAAPLAAGAEEANPAPPPAAPATPKITIGGFVDTYYLVNLTHAQDYASPTAGYEGPTGFNLNFAKLTTIASLDPVTARVDLGFGPEGAAISSTGTNASRLFLQQAFASLKLGKLTLDAGRFVTPGGFEVFESRDNWLYSKGLLFNFALPTAHEGVRLAVPLSGALTLTGYVTNGSDLFSNDLGNPRSPYKTAIASLLFAKDATTAALTAYYSLQPGTNGKSAYLVDAIATQGFGALSVNLSGDYGSAWNASLAKSSAWYGVGASAKFSITEPLAAVARVEYLSDEDGFHTGAALVPAESFVSATLGASYAVASNASLRAELRYDRADEEAYRGATDGMASLYLAALAWF